HPQAFDPDLILLNMVTIAEATGVLIVTGCKNRYKPGGFCQVVGMPCVRSPIVLARKGGASTSAAFEVPTPAKPGSPGAEDRSEPTLADIGCRSREEDEAVRNLLIDTDRRIGALDDLKDAFRNLVEAIGSALQALEQEKSDNVGLRNALAELRAGHESVRTEFSALEKRAAEWKAGARSWAGN